ncbi:MAG: septum formation initiator family protein [Gemmatimonadota bacterium]
MTSERRSRAAFRGITALGVLGAAYYLFLGGEYSVFDVRELQRTRDQAALVVDSLEAVADSLASRADSLTGDAMSIERLARERYGFIRNGERLYRFVPAAEAGPASAADASDPRKPGPQEVDGGRGNR